MRRFSELPAVGLRICQQNIDRPDHVPVSIGRFRVILAIFAANASPQLREEMQSTVDLDVPEMYQILLNRGRRCIALSRELRRGQFFGGHPVALIGGRD